MKLQVTVATSAPRPAAGTAITIEVRDTSLADLAAVTVVHLEEPVAPGDLTPPGPSTPLATVPIELPDDLVERNILTGFAHVRVAGLAEVTSGDLLSVQSYPNTPGDTELVIEVVQI